MMDITECMTDTTKWRKTATCFALAALGAFLAAGCGGGGGGGTVAGGTPIVSSGTMTKGSVIVNGVRFEDTLAAISGDDSQKTAADLQSGMVVTVTGTRNAEGVSGTADSIEIENEVRGPIETIALPESFTVLGQTVLVDGGTIFANVANLAALQVGDNVEVHGARDAAGNIRATRVERLGPGDVVDEVRGPVASLTASSFTIGGLTITFDGTTEFVPAGATLSEGDIVEVHLAGSFAARIEIEDFAAAEGQEVEVEGFVTGFTSLDAPFFVAGQEVQLDPAGVRFRGGVAADLANDVKVEAEGRMEGGVLVADEIDFKDAVRFESTVEAVNAADNSFTLLGKTIFVRSTTENNAEVSLGRPIAANDNVKVRGFVNQDNVTITATRIDETGPIDDDRHIVQALVGPFDAVARTLFLLGIEVDAFAAQFRDDRDNDDLDVPITADEFFAALEEGVTVVKARGTPVGDPVSELIANRVELE